MAIGGNIMFRAQFTDLFIDRLPYMDEIMFENYDSPSLTYPQVFNMRESSRAYEDITQITGFGLFSEKSEGDVVDYDKLLQGFDKRFTHITYSKGTAISMEAADDDIDGAIVNTLPPLARSARTSIEVKAWNVINGGFGATTTPDGAALFSASHVLRGGGTYDNLVSGDLSIATLETALNIFDNMIDDRGLPIELNPAMIVFPVELRWLVYEILKSDLRSDTAENATNAFKQIALGGLMSKYLTGADDWFVCSEPSQHRLLFYWRMDPMTDHTIDFDTGNLKTKMTYRMSVGAADWRGWVGGQGA